MRTKLCSKVGIIVLSIMVALMLGWGLASIQNEKTAANNSAVFAVSEVARLADLVDVKNTADWSNTAALECVDNTKAYSASNPYKIASRSDLIKLAYLINESDDTGWCTYAYKMINHIDLSGYNWVPIGTDDKPFCGTFDGDGHSIYGLTIVDEDVDDVAKYAGLFGRIDLSSGMTGAIKRLGLKDTIIVSARNYVGALAGYVTTKHGIEDEWIGYENDERAYSEANLGIVSFAIEDCYNTGFIQGGKRVGGLVGFIENAVNPFSHKLSIFLNVNVVLPAILLRSFIFTFTKSLVVLSKSPAIYG